MIWGILFLLLTIILLIGLASPERVLLWDMRPTRTKVILYWLGAVLLLVAVAGQTRDADKEAFREGEALLEDGKYTEAIAAFGKVDSSHELYPEARRLLNQADSLNTIRNMQIMEQRKEELKQQLEKELGEELLNGGARPDGFRESIEALELELTLFSGWAKMIADAEASEEEEIRQLGQKLKAKVVAYQRRAFPDIRRKYAEYAGRKLWEENIDVRISGKGNTTLDLSGGYFASNKNIKDTQEMLHRAFTLYRFKRIQYRWYKGADEYTYYKVESPDDGELLR